MWADCKVPDVPVIFLEKVLVSLSEEKLKVHQFLVTQNPADFGKSLVSAPEIVVTIDMFAGDWDVEAD